MDLFLIYPLEWFVSQTDPTEELTYKRPIDSLFSFPIVFSLLGQFTISIFFQYGGYFLLKRKYNWEKLCIVTEEGDPEPCPENTIIYIINQFQLIFSAISLYKTHPYRRSLLTNKSLLLYLISGILFTIYLTLFYHERINFAFDLFDFMTYGQEKKSDKIPDKYHMINYYLVIISIINAIVNILFEWFFVEIANDCWWEKQYNMYKKSVEKEKIAIKDNYIFNLKEEIPISNYIKLYYSERRKKLQIKNNNTNLIDDYDEDGIELEDMTPSGKIIINRI